MCSCEKKVTYTGQRPPYELNYFKGVQEFWGYVIGAFAHHGTFTVLECQHVYILQVEYTAGGETYKGQSQYHKNT